jgi:hypothetical protein
VPRILLLGNAAQNVRGQGRAREPHSDRGIETAYPGYLGAQDTFYVGTMKGVGRIYQQTFIATYSKVAQVKLYDRQNALFHGRTNALTSC